jgi:hypothetical protein
MDKVIIRKQDRIDYVINGICNYFGLDRNEFGRKYVRDRVKFNSKRFAMLILYDVADCTLKDINSALHYSDSTALVNVHTHISNLRMELEYDKKLQSQYKDILKYLNL